MKVLLVDDDELALAPLQDEIEQRKMGIEWRQVAFEQAALAIEEFVPELIVLDVFSGSPLAENATGRDRLDDIWHRCFRPVIVYSADPDVISEDHYRQHPFIKLVKKGRGSDSEVVGAIQEFMPLTELLGDARRRIEDEFSKALRDVAPLAAASGGDLAHVVERAARRRVAALVDETGPSGDAVAAWEQYVFPPVTDGIRQGDVLCDDAGAEPSHYRIVLTPSCDLVTSPGRSPKVNCVLLARCVDLSQALNGFGIGGGKSKKGRDRLRRMLNAGVEGHLVLLPPLADRIPSMAADLRRLELVRFEEIRKAFRVVASVDSPFREAIVWAYVRSTGRPGLPERDVDSWVDAVVERMSNDAKGGA